MGSGLGQPAGGAGLSGAGVPPPQQEAGAGDSGFGIPGDWFSWLSLSSGYPTVKQFNLYLPTGSQKNWITGYRNGAGFRRKIVSDLEVVVFDVINDPVLDHREYL